MESEMESKQSLKSTYFKLTIIDHYRNCNLSTKNIASNLSDCCKTSMKRLSKRKVTACECWSAKPGRHHWRTEPLEPLWWIKPLWLPLLDVLTWFFVRFIQEMKRKNKWKSKDIIDWWSKCGGNSDYRGSAKGGVRRRTRLNIDLVVVLDSGL